MTEKDSVTLCHPTHVYIFIQTHTLIEKHTQILRTILCHCSIRFLICDPEADGK